MKKPYDIVVAASDTPETLKRYASHVCPVGDARPALQRAIDEAGALDVKCVLLPGTYRIDSRGERSPRGALCFWNDQPEERWYSHEKPRFRTLEGAVEPMAWHSGAVIEMGCALYDSLGADEEFSLFYCDGGGIFGRAWILRNLVIQLPDVGKRIVAVDGRFCGALKYNDLWVAARDPRLFNPATCEGLAVPHPRSVGIRGTAGSNHGVLNEWKRCSALGFGTGFDIGGEHVYCESLEAKYNVTGFAFDCYKGKRSIDALDDEPPRGGCFYPIYCVNLLDEHNVHMPRFGSASHRGMARENRAQSVTIRAMNVQWPNTAPGYTDRRASDFTVGRLRATEDNPGAWRGSVEYVIDHTTPEGRVNLVDEPFFESGHGIGVRTLNLTVPADVAELGSWNAGQPAVLLWTFPDGSQMRESMPLARAGDGTLSLRIPAARLRASGAVSLRITPDFGHAEKGEAGWWFSPYGYYGEWDRDDGLFRPGRDRMNMPMFGWATPRGAWLAVIESLRLYPRMVVEAHGGRYSVSCELGEELCRDPYEDFEIVFHPFPAGTDYATLARRYRELRLARGEVRPLRDRAAENPALAYATTAPEIRIRQAWKPVPSPVPHQQPENEPPVHVAVTFDRVRDISRALRAAGVETAELCLVGWNVGGHDGRWPQSFPAEPLLGGDGGLRAAIGAVRADGYQIVPHGNFRDGYEIADSWDAEWTAKTPDGLPDYDPGHGWGGGLPYYVCPQRAYERFATKDIPRMAAFGFCGLGYFDCVSIVEAPRCHDARHPCSRVDSARWWGRCAEVAKRELGGFASEGAMDHFAGSLDSVLYASWDTPPQIEGGNPGGGGLASRHVPIVQLVYGGIWLQNPFTLTVNATVRDRYWLLKLLEYGGRPTFYFHSKFLTGTNNWTAQGDLSCATDADLAASVAKIRECCEIWRPFARLQFEFMDGHDRLAPGVFLTTWGDGTRLVTNYGADAFAFEGRTVPPLDFLLLESRGYHEYPTDRNGSL